MLKLTQTQLLLHTKTSTTNKVKNSMKSNWVFCRTTKFRQGRESWLTKKNETRIKYILKSAYAYWEPDERRSNKQRLRSGHSAFWVGLNTAFPSLFRRTPFLPGSLPSQPKPALCRCQPVYTIPMVQISEWRSLGLSNSGQNPPTTSPKLLPSLFSL